MVAPGNDCRKLRHPPSVGQTLSPHQSRPSPSTLGRIRLLDLTSSSTEASTLTLHQGRPKPLVKYLCPPSFSSQPDSTYILKSSFRHQSALRAQKVRLANKQSNRLTSCEGHLCKVQIARVKFYDVTSNCVWEVRLLVRPAYPSSACWQARVSTNCSRWFPLDHRCPPLHLYHA